MLIKEKIRFNGNISGGTMNFKFSLGSNDNFIGYQQEIDNLTEVTALDLVNPVIDAETRKFKLSPTIPTPTITLQFKFYSGTYQTHFIAAGFTANEIIQNDTKLLNSFFILDFYDTYDVNTQTKIFTTYLTKIIQPPSYIPQYSIGANTNNQLYYWYVPISYLTGTTRIGYVKFSFFNAKTGTLKLFYNEDNASITTPEYLFFKTELNVVNKTWRFITTSSPLIIAKEIINNALYINRVNDTVSTMDNLEQNPPVGNTYDYTNNTYRTT